MSTSKHTAIYVRVSTGRQDHASQIPDLERWATAHDGPVVWYRDKFTGRTMDRPGMAKLMKALRAGRIDRIVVWRLDRLGRTARGLLELFDELRARKADLVSLREGFTLSTPAGRMLATILSSVAQYETEVRAERILAGQAAARAAGKTWGGSVKGRLLKVTPEQVAAITSMTARGEPIAKVARTLGLSRPTVYRVLANHAK